MPFDFYLPDIANFQMYLNAMLKACAVGIGTSLLIVLADQFGWPKWLALGREDK